MKMQSLLAGAVAIGSLVACAKADYGSDAPLAGNTAPTSAQLQQCPAPLGTIALVESQIPSLAQIGLNSPTPAIRLMAQHSHCFNVVDRGQALTRMQEERVLSQGGMLQAGSNVGGGQIVAADYLITPNVIFANNNSGGVGASVGSILGSYVPHMGLLASTAETSLHFKEAQAVLAVTDTRSGVQTAVAEGHARASDLSAGLGVVNLPGFAGLSGYGNTNEGKVVSEALLDAFNNLVVQLRASPPAH